MLKRIAQALGHVLVLPLRARFFILAMIVGPDRALSVTSEAIASRPGLIGIATRQAFYRATLGATGADIHFGFMTLFSKTATTLGDRVYLGRYCTVGWAVLGDNVKIGDGVQLLSGGRHHSDGDEAVTHMPITIGAGAWVGAGAIIMADVGAGAIVGAGAVVTRPVAAGDTVGGVPAKSLKPTTTMLAA